MSKSLPPAIDAEERILELPACGRVLCYVDAGGAGVPVMLLHSINAAPSAREVRPLFDHLRGERPVFAIDLPGFGRSDRAAREYSPEFYAQAIIEASDALGLDSVHLLALSTTSEFAARAALAAPGRIASLVLISPTGLGERSPPSETTKSRILGFLQTPLLGRGLYRLLRIRPSVRFFLGMAFEGAPPAALVDYACATAAQPGARHAPFYFLSGKLFDADPVGRLYLPVKVPGLVVYDRDPNVSFERLGELLAGNTLWRARRIVGTRGLPQYDQPEQLFPVLDEFWGP
jgi:pimeloyl-ACP methyl ester carboxylesterase